MAPIPLEGNQTPVGNNVPQEGNRGGSISLAILIDFIIQRTYHELTVLAELLPRKTDMERKIEIFNFSARTRQLFVRLLALVKWANSASKVDKSAHIMAFLDKQSLLFVDTADMLARMARDTLVNARLPNFHIPAAVEVLTTGTYSRLPLCIRERIVPPDPITNSERRSTLLRLNQVIQHRLVTGNLLPQMRDLKIESGRVTFTVKNEFEVSLTVMGDGPNIPWRLLDIDILVEDKETGGGKALVHPLQVQYIHQVLQTRLVDNAQPLTEVYNCLHYFCQSLQLEVLHSQTEQLRRNRLDDHIHVDDYTPGKCLSISYWRELTSKDPRSELGYRLTVQVDQHDPAKPLTVIHVPSLGSKLPKPGEWMLAASTCVPFDGERHRSDLAKVGETCIAPHLSRTKSDYETSPKTTGECSIGCVHFQESEIADRAIRSELLSMERLLVHTIYVRTRNRLSELKQELHTMLKDVDCELNSLLSYIETLSFYAELLFYFDPICVVTVGHLQGSPAILSVPVLQPCLRAEQLLVTVDTHTGMLQCHVPQYWITQRRCEKTLQHLPATPHERLPLLHHPDHPMSKIGRHRMFVRLHRHPNVILIVEFKEKDNSPCEIDCFFYLAVVKHSSIEDDPHDDSIETEIPKMYLKVLTLIEFESFVTLHGPFTSVDEQNDKVGTKRKTVGRQEGGSRRTKHPAYFIPELAHVVALTDERLPIIALAQELAKREIGHQGVQVEANATALMLRVLDLPPPPGCKSPSPGGNPLCKRLLAVTVRSQGKANKSWMAEFVFHGSPLASTHPKEQGLRRPVYFQYDMGNIDNVSKTVDALLSDWAQVVHLYMLVEGLAEYFRMVLLFYRSKPKLIDIFNVIPEKVNLLNIVTIKSYSYSRLVLGYGPDKGATVTVYWNSEDKAFRLIFGATNNCVNAHTLMREQFEAHLNRHRNLALIVSLLHLTYEPLVSISKLPTLPQLGVHNSVRCSDNLVKLKCSQRESYRCDGCLQRPQVPVQTFTIIPQAPNLLRLSYQGMYCLELRMRGGGLVSLRDGAYSRFDRSNVVEEFTPTQGLKARETDSVYRRRSQSEDDNPPSPITMDTEGGGPMSFLGSHRPGPQSPAQQRETGLRFHPPLTPPSGSNPHTPASPHPAISQSMTSPAASNWPGSPSMPRPSPARPGQSPGGTGHPSMHSPQTDLKIATLPLLLCPTQALHCRLSGSHLSRVLPQRSWAGAVPTLLTHEALDLLCSPSPHPQGLPGPELSPLERFLGCVYMRRQLQRFIQSEECVSKTNLTSSRINSRAKFTWMTALNIVEKFFDTRAAAPPYKPNNLSSFGRMLNVPYNVLKDFVQLMKLELLQITRVGLQYPPNMDPPSLVLPLVYDMSTNLTQLAEKRDPQPSATTAASHQLKRFAEMGVNHMECSLFPAVRDLLANLILPNEPPQQQVASSPNPAVMQPSPAMQMHSPMPSGGVGLPQGQPGGPGGAPQQPGAPPQPQYSHLNMGQHPMMGGPQ
uniref:Mediator of RNA polymerase II transcription subunit 14 n=1 Tax=Timema poppense TaxID=170557 RepID=A0A7R9D300_TIMPO|nr:unnamed protein product [Timema poppensis]